MNRSLALWCAPLLFAGCHNSPQPFDPFLPATVPPPATGAAAGSAAPYYSAPAEAPYPSGGNYNSPPPASAPAGAPYQGETNPQPTDRWPMTKRDSSNRQSSSLPAAKAKPGAVHSHLASASEAGDQHEQTDSKQTGGGNDAEESGSRVVQANHAKIVKVIHSHSNLDGESALASAAGGEEPRKLPAADDAVDIMDLPPARSAVGSRMAQRISPLGGGKVVRTSATEPAEPSAGQRYAYSPDYKKLNGQLEYSLAERRWKLRYVPIDGETDSHGGSVVLLGKPPEGFQAGDFVTVEGRLAGEAAAGEFAPEYQFDQIEPLAD
ncbi:MAG TPA: hypothetical protein VMV10_29495 [Pirellulales bacterium]|nr:hypothetical protein [Pirellulales bacterium]